MSNIIGHTTNPYPDGDDEIHKRISLFFHDMGQLTEKYGICFLNFKFSTLHLDIEATVLDRKTDRQFDILMNPESREIFG